MRPLSVELGESELRRLGEALGGCDFTGEPQRRFLLADFDCDVQAAPGSGKTTLLVAKLDILARRWEVEHQGICVLSHTNAARREVENQLQDREAAAILLGHPHFIGTITTFVHRFLAMPYLRGEGAVIQKVDDDTFEYAALRLAGRNEVLQKWRRALESSDGDASRQYEGTVCKLTYDKDLRFRLSKGVPGHDTDTGKALQDLKDHLARMGYFRYSDMTAYAQRSLQRSPVLARILARRFPVVFLDEAQDTSEEHLDLIDQIFRSRSTLQRLGDANQTIYGDGSSEIKWSPRPETAIPLGGSWRFGQRIATFASKLTCRCAQQIVGTRQEQGQHTILLYDEASREKVIPWYGGLVVDQCSDWNTEGFQAWVVASRIRGDSHALMDFDPSYLPPSKGSRVSGTMIHALRQSQERSDASLRMDQRLEIFAAGLVSLLRQLGIKHPQDRRWSPGTLWRGLHDLDQNAGAALRLLLRDCVVGALDIDTPTGWTIARARLLEALASAAGRSQHEHRVEQYLAYHARQNPDTSRGYVPCNEHHHKTDYGYLVLRLGSIASVKGQTHDATLVVQTKAHRTIDLRNAVGIAFGGTKPPSEKNPGVLKAVTNVFVASTRPRHLLALALPAKDFKRKYRASATDAGWDIIDLTKRGD